MVIKRQQIHGYIFYFSLVLLVIGLPLSKFLMSVAQFLLLGNWLLEGHLKEKFSSFFRNKVALVLTSVFALHLLWLINTANFNYGLNDIRIKLPLLIFPLVLSTTKPPERKKAEDILRLFITAVVIASFVSIAILKGWYTVKIRDYRSISIFISHIRFALLICIAVFSSLHLLRHAEQNWLKNTYRLVILWLCTFLFILQSFTGIVILLAALAVYMVTIIRKEKRRLPRITFFSVALLTPLLVFLYIYRVAKQLEPKAGQQMKEFTLNHNRYSHFPGQRITENGYYTGWNICWPELERAWNSRSKISYKERDLKGQFIETTLIRYLSSKGLDKDSVGVHTLSAQDIANIEKGHTNFRYAGANGLEEHIYQTLWEFRSYRQGDNPSGHSVTMRLEFLKAASGVFADNWLTGTGTGDVNDATLRKYEEIKTPLDKKYRLRAHNQFLTFGVSFGILGLLVFLFSLLYPLTVRDNYFYYLYFLFFLTAAISMLNEDTLETQAGVTFFAFFNSFFLFMGGKKDQEER